MRKWLLVLLIIVLGVRIGFLIIKKNRPQPDSIIKKIRKMEKVEVPLRVTIHSYPTYPDPKLTPGDIVNYPIEKICVSGYSDEERHVTNSRKKEVYAEYGVPYPQPKGSYEVDHFMPVCIGGSNEMSNLWLQPAQPYPGYHEKDQLEQYLCRAVCRDGKMTIQEAQNLFRTDWYKAYQQYIEIRNESR